LAIDRVDVATVPGGQIG